MISLIPSWAHHYNEFWDLIRKRNLWFIKLRFSAVGMLVLFILAAEFIIGIKFTPVQIFRLYFITGLILFYNALLQYLSRFVASSPDHFNPLHFSLIQMLLDITALFLLVYHTGSIESPLFLLFVFHMIIGSLILPGIVVYSIAIAIVALFTSIVFLEYYGVIMHYSAAGFLMHPIYSDFNYIISFTIFFAFLIFMSVVLANNIARQLYKNEEKLLESLDKLNKAEEEKQKYIIGVVHELKSPIAGLMSYLDLILQKYVGPLNEAVEQKLTSAKERAVEALYLINNIMKISRLRLTTDIVKEEFKLKEIVCSVISKQKTSFESKQITLKLTDEMVQERPIEGDKFLMEMAISNLITNAIKYVGKDGIIDISLSGLSEGISLEISDNGVGIPANEHDNIFKDFYRASNIKNKGYEGAGLGLSVVKQIIIRHRGTIMVQSPGKIATPGNPGTTFKIFIPF